MLKSVVNELRLIKSILIKSNKFIKSAEDFSFKGIYFIVLRYFYIRPFFRFLIKGKNHWSKK